MLLKLTATIESCDNNEFIAWVDNDKFKGTIVQSESPIGAWQKLLTAIKVKIAYDYDIEIDSIEEKEISPSEFKLLDLPKSGKKDINLTLT